jgi:hypothetical protein
VLWAYDGFADLSFAAGEVRNPQRNLPLAIIGGTSAVIAVYLLANLAYLYVLPLDRVRQSPLVAADTMMAIFGGVGAVLVSSLVTMSAFSSLNGIMLSSPRVFFAMAEDGSGAARTCAGRFKTPHLAILLRRCSGRLRAEPDVRDLSNTFVLAIWPSGADCQAGYRLRRIRPALSRSYHVIITRSCRRSSSWPSSGLSQVH